MQQQHSQHQGEEQVVGGQGEQLLQGEGQEVVGAQGEQQSGEGSMSKFTGD